MASTDASHGSEYTVIVSLREKEMCALLTRYQELVSSERAAGRCAPESD